MPLNGDRLDFTSKMVEDFSRSTWSNLPVKIKLEARDALDKSAVSDKIMLAGAQVF